MPSKTSWLIHQEDGDDFRNLGEKNHGNRIGGRIFGREAHQPHQDNNIQGTSANTQKYRESSNNETKEKNNGQTLQLKWW